MAGIDIDAPGTSHLLMGNEAIARGALEAGIGFAAAYPGTPSTEIMESLVLVAEKMGIYTEWSANETVAAEAAAGASYAGIRAITAMKHNGLNVASNFLANLIITGIGKGGLILVSCDDPSAHSSSVEEDSRGIAKWWDIPLLEPGDFQEAKDMTKWLFDLSEELGSICLLRSVTRISHARGNVKLGELPKKEFKAHFDDTYDVGNPMPGKFLSFPAAIRHGQQHQRLDKAREKFESSPFNWYVGPDKAELLVITGGSCWLYSREAVEALKLEDRVGILKLGTLWPLPEKFVASHLTKSQKILVAEETDPFLEQSVMELASSLPRTEPRPVFYGRRSGHISVWGELNPSIIMKAITSIIGLTYQPRDTEYAKKAKEMTKSYVPARTWTFCPGCSHRASYWAIKNALRLDGRDGIVTGDIGCMAMGMSFAGWFQMRTKHGMGSSIGIASGLGKLGRFGLDQPILAVIGDSTFFHAGIPGLINAIHQRSDFITVIMDNNATAMTGFQPHPGNETGGREEPAKAVSIEALCRSLGVHVEVYDPFDLKNTTATLLEMMAEGSGAKVVIMRRECELMRGRREKKNPYKVHVEPDKCIGEACGCDRLCTRVLSCPGLVWSKEAGKPKIDEVICTGCGVCADICPQGAIIKEAA